MDRQEIYKYIYAALAQDFTGIGFTPVTPEGKQRNELPFFERPDGGYFEYTSESKGRVRLVFSETKIVLIAGPADATGKDDSQYTVTAGHLFTPDEYSERDLKSLCNEMREDLTEAYTEKQINKRQQNIKAQPTVTRSQVKSGAMLYDSATLAIKLSAMYPELKSAYTAHLEYYDEFLCETFFTEEINPKVYRTIKEGNPQQLKKLFNILGEVYEDGSNEVQDVIVVTMLASMDFTDEEYNTVLKYVSDAMVEQLIRVRNTLKKSRSARMRLENPPRYKPPKKKKSGGLLSNLMGGGGNGLQS